MTSTATNWLTTQNHYTRNLDIYTKSDLDMAGRILKEFINFSRVPDINTACDYSECTKCSNIHLSKILSAVREYKAIEFVLPSFPGKSPNYEKVLGHLPDYAETLSFSFLGNLCKKIKHYYTPGIKIILCSDGRVFSDVVGMNESHVTEYQTELNKLIRELALKDISTFNLDDYYKNLSFKQMRTELMQAYGNSVEFLKYKISNGATATASSEELEANLMYKGITRFLFEDSMHVGQTKSRTKIQKESRCKAFEVIRRSNAWSQLIADHFPEAVRLSIHPQICGSKKLGIRLIHNETWMTPWHGVAVETKDGYILLKRSQAEKLGAELVYATNGRPSYYRLNNQQISVEGS